MRGFFGLLLLLTATASSSWAQSLRIRTLCRLPKNITESSGVCMNPDGTLWTNNDSGDKPRVYKVDTLGNLLQTLYLRNASAYDYEDLTRDKQGNLYVCDCGNNFNNRQNLCIYKISKSELESGTDTVTPQTIHFSYPDQTQFPPPKEKRNFDCESIVVYQDSIFLFSKNRGVSHYSKRYVLPSKPGTYIANLRDSVKTNRWVTSAALSPDDKTFILLSENKLTIFTDFRDSFFFSGIKTKVHIPITQKEGITFKNNKEIYLTDEIFKGFGGKIYSADLSGLLNSLNK